MEGGKVSKEEGAEEECMLAIGGGKRVCRR